MRKLAALLVTLALTAIPCAAQDTDGDGRSDAVEKQLATDPAFAESLEVVAEDAAGDVKQEGGERFDITRVRFGNVAATVVSLHLRPTAIPSRKL